MLRNFLLITFRNFLKNKTFVIVNVLGLGIAMACCIVAWYNYKFNADFDSFHTQKEQIYKVSIKREVNNRQQAYGITPLSLAPAMGNSISGISEIVRVTYGMMPIRYGDNMFSKRIVFADSNFFDVFDLTMIDGDKNSIREASNVIISQEFADICFGEKNPMGEAKRDSLRANFDRQVKLEFHGTRVTQVGSRIVSWSQSMAWTS